MECKEVEEAPKMEIQVSNSSVGWKESGVKKCKGCCDVWLPFEVQYNILAKLRGKDLVRCQCVSKKWQDEIQNAVFSKMLSSQIFNDNANTSTQVILVRPENLRVYVIDLSRLEVVGTLVHGHPIEHRFKTIGTCNGLLCLMNCSLRQIQVYNPKTSGSRVIDIPGVTFGGKIIKFHDNFFGFGYDCRSKDYKILNIPRTRETQAMLFSFKNNSWELVQPCPFDYSSRTDWDYMVFYSNVLHWVAVVDVVPCKIICFDLENNKYYELPKPSVVGGIIRKWSLIVARGLLNFVNVNTEKNRLEFWVMEVYGVKESWNSWLQLSLEQVCPKRRPLRPTEKWSVKQSKLFVYSEDAKKIIIAVGRRFCAFVAVDLITGKSEFIGRHLYPISKTSIVASFFALSWATSQVSPNNV